MFLAFKLLFFDRANRLTWVCQEESLSISMDTSLQKIENGPTEFEDFLP